MGWFYDETLAILCTEFYTEVLEMSTQWQNRKRAQAKVAKYNAKQDNLLWLFILLAGGITLSALLLGKLLLISP